MPPSDRGGGGRAWPPPPDACTPWTGTGGWGKKAEKIQRRTKLFINQSYFFNLNVNHKEECCSNPAIKKSQERDLRRKSSNDSEIGIAYQVRGAIYVCCQFNDFFNVPLNFPARPGNKVSFFVATTSRGVRQPTFPLPSVTFPFSMAQHHLSTRTYALRPLPSSKYENIPPLQRYFERRRSAPSPPFTF